MYATSTSSTATPALRLTRRGRAVLVLLLAALLLAAISLGHQDTQAASVLGDGVAVTQLEQTTVQPGESLWSVAQRIAPDNDPREVVAQLRRLNDLESSQLQVGQHLLLPTRA
jgi:LysM repeat protein